MKLFLYSLSDRKNLGISGAAVDFDNEEVLCDVDAGCADDDHEPVRVAAVVVLAPGNGTTRVGWKSHLLWWVTAQLVQTSTAIAGGVPTRNPGKYFVGIPGKFSFFEAGKFPDKV